MEDYEKYRWFFCSSGNLVIGGKNEEQNESLVKEFIGKPNTIMHTEEPGSPFCILTEKPSKRDIEETAVFTASFSQQWKSKKKKAEVHIFTGRDVKKQKHMKTGTFFVLNFKEKKVNLELKLAIQKQKLRAVPLTIKSEENLPQVILKPGNIDKIKISEILKQKLDKAGFNFKKESIEQAIPTGGFKIE